MLSLGELLPCNTSCWILHHCAMKYAEKLQKSMALLCCGEHFAGMLHLDTLVTLDGSITANHYRLMLTDHLYSMKKHFYPDWSCFFHDENALTHRAQGLAEFYDEHENDLNHKLWPLQSLVHLWNILGQNVR